MHARTHTHTYMHIHTPHITRAHITRAHTTHTHTTHTHTTRTHHTGPDCNMTTEIGCYSDDNNDPVHCIPMSARCDNISQCANNVDESLCCGPEMFGCYVNDSQSWSNVIFLCLENLSLCDGIIDCADGSDENETMCGKRDS